MIDQRRVLLLAHPGRAQARDVACQLVDALSGHDVEVRLMPDEAAALGLHSALSVRLWTASHTLGTMTLYAERPRAFDADSVAIAEILGRHASVALASARHEESLTQAIDARKLVGQAQGILMERFDLDDRQAFDVLRRYSQTTNTKLNEVARMLVDTRRLPDL